MLDNKENFIQQNSPDGGFLQSEEWREFQETFGRKTFHLEGEGFWANIIEHTLPLVGNYFYIPRGPIMAISNFEFPISNEIQNFNDQILKPWQELVGLAKENKAGWIRVDVENEGKLDLLKKEFLGKIKKAPHDMQPKEVFVVDISKSEEDLLMGMKSKTRYNIRLAEKKEVKVLVSSEKKYVKEFLRLVAVTAERDGITSHPGDYYRKMLETIPSDILKLFVAEYQGKIIAANLVLFYGSTCTYLHGASDNESRNVMAPYLLQWRQIQEAKKLGCTQYDFGGVKIGGDSSWAGITNFKIGFSPETKPTEFRGSYDIVVSYPKYFAYRFLQRLKNM